MSQKAQDQRAEKLRAKIAELKEGKSAPRRETPNQFIHRRMSELAAEEKDNPKPGTSK